MKLPLLLLAITALFTTSGSAARFIQRTNAQMAAESKWIFIGRVIRVQSFPSNIIGGADIQHTVQVGRVLYGSPPKTAVLYGSAVRPSASGSMFIFFADPPKVAFPGIDAVLGYGAIRPYAEIKEIEQLVTKRSKQ